MSVLIRDMEMPTSCVECKLRMAVGCCGKLPHNTRMPNCPVTHVPPHGRLGDLDALHKLFLEKGKEYKGVGGAMVAAAAWCIANAPTIIPASEEGK